MMTVHVLHAGDGYTYLTRQVASGDTPRQAGESLADYYAHEGNPPGRWVGAGLTGLGISGQVTEEQMKALFGEGLHPDADRLIREAMADGASAEEAVKTARLGRRFPRFEPVDDEEWTTSIRAAYADFKAAHGRAPEAGVERDLIRWDVAGTILAGRFGRQPVDAERSHFLARLGRQQRQPVAGYDLVFTPAKSVSTLWALADEEVRSEVAAAHEAAWQGAFEWVEQEAGLTRVGTGGAAQIDTRGLVAATFDHADSRTGDPNLHTHVAVSNKVQGSDGKWRALDARVLHSLGVAASERYNTLIEEELRSRLGVRFVDEERGRGKQPVREIEGIDARVRAAFSSRRVAIEEVYAELTERYRAEHGHEPPKAVQLRLAQQATLDTREGKEDGVTLSERRQQWRRQAAEVLGDEAHVTEMIAAAVHRDSGADGTGVDVDELARRVVEEVQAKRATWKPWHLMAEAMRQARQHATGDLTAVAEQVAARAEALSLRLDPPELNPVPEVLQRADGESVYTVHGQRVLTSQAVLDAEHNLVQGALRTGGPVVGEQQFSAALRTIEEESGRTLNDSQRELARAFATSGRELVAGIGPAGTGKTTAMTAFARAVENTGGRVLALAPSAAAASVLGEELGVTAETLHKLIHAHRSGTVTEALRVDASTVLLVDEAGMAGTPLLDQALTLAREHGASVRLLGDPQQLAAVEAGGALRLIDERVGAVRLEQVHRFTDPDEAAASLRLRTGEAGADDFYLERGRVRGGTREGMLEEVYAAWSADTEAGQESVMIAGSNTDVTALAGQARRDLVAVGRVESDGIVLHDGNRAGRGDRVVTRLNDRTLPTANGKDFVKNGDVWEVLDRADDGRLRVRHTRHGGTLNLPAGYVAGHVELAYAATVHRVQGMTVDTSHALLDASTDRQSLYTALTRGRQDNRVYLVTDTLLGADGHDETGPARSPAQVFAGIIARDGAALSATTAQENAFREAHSLARLVPEVEDALDRFGHYPPGLEPWRPAPDAPEWITVPDSGGHPQVREWAARHVELIEQRVDRLTDLALAGRTDWSRELGLPHDDVSDEAVVGTRLVAAYRDRYGITGTDPLGARPEHGHQVEDYRRASAALENLRTGLARADERVPAPAGQITGEGPEQLQEPSAAERLRRHVHRSEDRKDDGEEQGTQDRLARAREQLLQRREARQGADRPDNNGVPRHGGPRRSGPQL
ncbi:MobF family relaxase [Georgenia soli]|nr:MobF family relaxase [Georgenia soli]